LVLIGSAYLKNQQKHVKSKRNNNSDFHLNGYQKHY
jgi:hypothetical protein